MYNTPNLSTMGLSAAAIPLTLTNAVLQLALGFAIVVTYLLLVRRSGGLRTRDFSLSTDRAHVGEQSGISDPAVLAQCSVPAQPLDHHDEVTRYDHNR
jgi:hypothetical protein